MKLCSFVAFGSRSYGLVLDDGNIVDLKLLLEEHAHSRSDISLSLLLGVQVPVSLTDCILKIVSGEISIDELTEEHYPEEFLVTPGDVHFEPPIPRPGKIMGVAINNQLAQAFAHRPFGSPAFFFKPTTALVGHDQPVLVKKEFGVTHPEPELAVIIGKGGKNISEQNALDHVFGYSILNDITSPGLKNQDSIELVLPEAASSTYEKLLDWRNNRDSEHSRSVYLTYHGLSKGADSFAPMGPWLVTADEIEDPNNLLIVSTDDRGTIFEDSTANLLFSVQEIISHASKYCTLETGDIIHCGTAMIAAQESQRACLSEWDITQCDGESMTVEIPGLGALQNSIVVES